MAARQLRVYACFEFDRNAEASMRKLRTDMDPLAVLGEIHCLEAIYPGFGEWYLQKVVPGIAKGTRLLIADVTDGEVSGVAIAKRDIGELKLCTVWRNERIGRYEVSTRLVRAAMSWLGTDRPVFTVPSDRIDRMRPLMNAVGVGAGVGLGDIYREGVDELLFNATGMQQ